VRPSLFRHSAKRKRQGKSPSFVARKNRKKHRLALLRPQSPGFAVQLDGPLRLTTSGGHHRESFSRSKRRLHPKSRGGGEKDARNSDPAPLCGSHRSKSAPFSKPRREVVYAIRRGHQLEKGESSPKRQQAPILPERSRYHHQKKHKKKKKSGRTSLWNPAVPLHEHSQGFLTRGGSKESSVFKHLSPALLTSRWKGKATSSLAGGQKRSLKTAVRFASGNDLESNSRHLDQKIPPGQDNHQKNPMGKPWKFVASSELPVNTKPA